MAEPNDPSAAPAAAPAGAPARQVGLQKIYLKDASMEVPLAPEVFTRPWKPEVEVQVTSEQQALSGDTHHVVLTVTVTAKLGKDVAFLAEARQGGLFLVRGFANAGEKAAVLGGYCPGLIFPFARETIADLVQRAGFPQLLLQPINFEALYLEHLQRQKAAAQGGAAPAQATH